MMDTNTHHKTKVKNSAEKQDFPLLSFNHLKRFSLVIITTLTIVLSLVALGHYLDQKLDTEPWLLVTGLILSFPLAQLMVYKRMKEFTKKEYKRLNIKENK